MRRQPTRASSPAPPAGIGRDAERVLLVAACAGARCTALRHLHAGGSDAMLRAAVRGRPDAVLLSTDCLGPCHRGSVAAVGWALTRPQGGGLDWTGPPLLLSLLDTPGRAAAVADWVRRGAPDRSTLPSLLADRDVT